MNSFKRGAVIVLASTTIALAGAVTKGMILASDLEEEQGKNNAYAKVLKEHEAEIYQLKNEINAKGEAIVYLSETNLEIKDEFDDMVDNYEKLSSDYKANLSNLNKVREELKKKKLEASVQSKQKYSHKSVDVSEGYRDWTRMSVESTAYTKYENGDKLAGRKWGNITASGLPVQYGHISVDTRIIPLGTQVYIPSLNKVFIATDTGNAIKGKIIDIYFNSLEECIQWGRKHNLEVYVNFK